MDSQTQVQKATQRVLMELDDAEEVKHAHLWKPAKTLKAIHTNGIVYEEHVTVKIVFDS